MDIDKTYIDLLASAKMLGNIDYRIDKDFDVCGIKGNMMFPVYAKVKIFGIVEYRPMKINNRYMKRLDRTIRLSKIESLLEKGIKEGLLEIECKKDNISSSILIIQSTSRYLINKGVPAASKVLDRISEYDEGFSIEGDMLSIINLANEFKRMKKMKLLRLLR
ncbi:hypothetical protein COT47_07580 [Candidatus Woesearchaeota archaeon CG08_land_8_20_14_0_20_43_7]|nr:MAG: hypothetical protein COT47_07580 [Candidatus Woesearchaeota archaeon CG08_land_8_20_14_0_20_43_7]